MPTYYKTVIQEGGVAGKGIFADQDIPKGGVWWRAWSEEPPVKPSPPNIVYTEETMNEYIATHTLQEVQDRVHFGQRYVLTNVIIYIQDDRRYTNHSSESPNSQLRYSKTNDWKRLHAFALRDIKKGEEILEDYANLTRSGSGWVEELAKKYDPERLQLEVDLKIHPNPNLVFEEAQ